MKKAIIFFASVLLVISCKDRKTSAVFTLTDTPGVYLPILPPPLIPKDSANKMVSSYLNSIHYANNDSDIYSMMIDAKELRLLLDSLEPTTPVKQIKVMFAHTLDYINSGHENTNAGYKRNAMTIVLIGVSSTGDYIFFPGNTAFNKSMPCPTSCPTGSASNPMLQ